MSSQVSREERIQMVLQAIRVESNKVALFSQAVADRLGLAGTDVDCLEVLIESGQMTVGQLAEATGITTGSATRMVDRLEQAGFVRRIADAADRRRVMVEAAPGTGAKLAALHESIQATQIERLRHYTDDQLALLIAFLNDAADVAIGEASKLRESSERASAAWEGGSYVGPLAGTTSARLVFLTGAPRVSVTGDGQLKDLYRAEFQGPVPRVRVRDGAVTVSYPKFGWFDWRAQIGGQFIDASAHWHKDRGEIVLNASIPWAIEMRGGVSSWTADLREIRLLSLELRGGASQLEMRLGEPVGIVPIRVVGGVNRLSIERPKGVAAGLEVRGGANEIEVDGQMHFGSGMLSLQSPGAEANPNRYEIELTGGASKVTISTR